MTLWPRQAGHAAEALDPLLRTLSGRIQAAAGPGLHSTIDAFGTGGAVPFLFSSLNRRINSSKM